MVTRWWQLTYFWNVSPRNLGKIFTLFDLRIFLQKGLKPLKPPTNCQIFFFLTSRFRLDSGYLLCIAREAQIFEGSQWVKRGGALDDLGCVFFVGDF